MSNSMQKYPRGQVFASVIRYINDEKVIVYDENVTSLSFIEYKYKRKHLLSLNTSNVSGPRIWNGLPEDVVSAPTLSSFRRRLKPFLFQQSYNDIVI